MLSTSRSRSVRCPSPRAPVPGGRRSCRPIPGRTREHHLATDGESDRIEELVRVHVLVHESTGAAEQRARDGRRVRASTARDDRAPGKRSQMASISQNASCGPSIPSPTITTQLGGASCSAASASSALPACATSRNSGHPSISKAMPARTTGRASTTRTATRAGRAAGWRRLLDVDRVAIVLPALCRRPSSPALTGIGRANGALNGRVAHPSSTSPSSEARAIACTRLRTPSLR